MLQNSQKQQLELQQRYTRKLENKNKELERAVFQAKKANAFEEDAKKCINAGMNAHMAKLFIAKVKYRKLQPPFVGNCRINGWGKCRF